MESETMEDFSNGLDITGDCEEYSIFKVLSVDLCAQAILDLVRVKDLVRSQRVCRWWQGVVHRYLQGCHTLSFHYVAYDYSPSYAIKFSSHRRIEMSPKKHSLLLASEIVQKWGPSIVDLNTAEDWHDGYGNKQYETFLNIISSKCPHLRKIKMFVNDERELYKIKNLKNLRHISLHYFNRNPVYRNKSTDQLLGEIFHSLKCESFLIEFNVNLTGSFLGSINYNNLKSLYFKECQFLKVKNMLPATDILRNLTTLHLDGSHASVLINVHLLLKKMPQLEELSLRGYDVRAFDIFTQVSFESFIGLVNLRRLYMENTKYVNDTLLKALAQGCKKLERLDIRGSASKISLDGLQELCSRSPSARTTLHFGVPEYEHDDLQLEIYFYRYFEDIDLFLHLESVGCVEMTLEWFRAACRDPRGRELPLNLNSDPDHTGDAQELKIILFDDTFEYFPPLE